MMSDLPRIARILRLAGSLRSRLMGLIVLALVPLAALVLYNAREQRRAGAAEAQAGALRLARICASNHDRFIEGARKLLITLAQIPSVREQDAEASRLIFAKLREQDRVYANIGMTDASGVVTASALPMEGIVNVGDRAYFQRAVERRDFAVGDFQTGRITGRPAVNVAYPILRDGRVAGVVYAALDLGWLNDDADRLKLPPGGALTLMDHSGRIVARHPDSLLWAGKSAANTAVGRAIAGGKAEGLAEGAGVDGEQRLFAYATLGEGGLVVSVGLPEDLALKPAREAMWRGFALLAMVAAVALAVAWLLGDVLVLGPIRRLLRATRALAAGDFSTRSGLAGGRGELAHLARAFDAMAASLERGIAERDAAQEGMRNARDELEDRVEERTAALAEAIEEMRRAQLFLNNIVENIPHMIFVKDARDLRFVRINRAGEALLGMRRIDMVGRNDHDFFPRSEADFFIAKDRAVLASKEVSDIPEEPIQTPAGTRILHTKKLPILSAAGEPEYLLGISEDITERRRAEEAARRQSEELARSNEELAQFAYVASHDLQEPLRMVASYTQLLERRYGDQLDADAREFIGFAVDGAVRMQRFINDLLEYSRVGTRHKPFEPVDLADPFAAAVANLKIAIDEAGAEITHDPLPTLPGDSARLAQLFQNLLANALKFRGERPPRIHVGARRIGRRWRISISDNGIGIAPEHFARIFVIFQRLHSRADYAGTGIGLSICKKIVERHGGRIWVESRPGEGAIFHFTLSEQERSETIAPA